MWSSNVVVKCGHKMWLSIVVVECGRQMWSSNVVKCGQCGQRSALTVIGQCPMVMKNVI